MPNGLAQEFRATCMSRWTKMTYFQTNSKMSRNRQGESLRCGTAVRGFINYFNGYEEKCKATNLEP